MPSRTSSAEAPAPARRRQWQAARKLLAIRLDASGDVLMCTPALHALVGGGAALTLLSSPAGALVGARSHAVQAVMPYAAPWMKAATGATSSAHSAMVDTLRAQQFDGAVIFTTYSQSALPGAMLCWEAGIPLRLAYCRENPYALLTDWIPEAEPDSGVRHEVVRQLDLVAKVGYTTKRLPLTLAISGADYAAAVLALATEDIDPKADWLLLHPGATAASRRYPAWLWSEVVDLLGRRQTMPLVFSGSAEEAGLIARIQENCSTRTVSLAGKLDFGGMAAAVRMATLLVSGNSAPAHVAAACQTPVVDLYALTNPQHTPWMVPCRVLSHPVPCQYCYRSICPYAHHACLAGISPAQVVDAVSDLLLECGHKARAINL